MNDDRYTVRVYIPRVGRTDAEIAADIDEAREANAKLVSATCEPAHIVLRFARGIPQNAQWVA